MPSNQIFKVLFVFIVSAAIFRLGYKLRLHQFMDYPALGDTYDEFKAPFNGLSLIKEGVPASWSWYPAYKDASEPRYISGGIFRIVRPWFDEPPLYSLMVGLYEVQHGIKTFEDIHIGTLRQPMALIGGFNVLVLFLIVYFTGGFWQAVFSSLVYATLPTAVLGSRMPLSDNMLATFTLLCLLFTILYLKTNKNIFLLLSALIAASSFQLKSTGVFVPVALTGVLWSFKKFKPSLIVISATIISLGAWFAYGYHYNWPLFREIMSVSSGRELTSPTVILNLFNTYRIGEKAMGVDGWLLWCWIAAILYSFNRHKNHHILGIFLCSYLIFFSIMSGHIKGWYRLPLYPLISWAAGWFVLATIKRPKLLPVFFYTAIPFFSSYVYGNGGINWSNPQAKIFQITFVATMTPFMLFYIFPKNVLVKRVCQLLFIGIFLLSIIYNYRTIILFQDYFYYRSL